MFPYAATFLINAAVLVFEIAGSRIVAPHFGTSIEVWSTLIAAVIGGLSLGYFLGGRIADYGRVREKLMYVVAISGLVVLVCSIIDDALLGSAATLGGGDFIAISIAGLTAVFAFFFVPSILFGMTYPLLAKIALTDSSRSGQIVGYLAAAGALGSIVGALGAGLVLIPVLGSEAIFQSVGLILIGLALLTWRAVPQTMIFFVFAAGTLHYYMSVVVPDPAVRADVDGSYARIIVRDIPADRDGTSIRTVQTDPFGTQCAMYVDAAGAPIDDEIVVGYIARMHDAIRAMPQEPESALFIGGCNYSLPRALRYDVPDIEMTVVELEEKMTEIAEEHFGLSEEPGFQIAHEDGRMFLNRASGTYDAVLFDVYGGGLTMPFQLSTVEAFAHVRRLLEEDGVLIVNAIGSLDEKNGRLLASVFMTLEEVFPHVSAHQVDRHVSGDFQNVLFIASLTPREEPLLPYDVTGELKEVAKAAGGIILTDNYAPVEMLARIR